MNWYKLEAVRQTLSEDHSATLTPGVHVPGGNLEVWERVVSGHTYVAFLNYENDELLVPEESLVAAAVALKIGPREFVAGIKVRGGLWLGPSPS